MKNVLKLFIIFLLFSCTKEIEIDIPQETPKIVAYSTIVPFTLPNPKPLGIKLQSSLHIHGKAQSKMDDATVIYFENGAIKDTLEYNNSLDIYNISNTMNDYPTAGNTYSIQIEKDGFETVTSSTTIPSRVKINDTAIVPVAYIDETGSAFSEISISFTDPADETNFYEISVSDNAFKYDSLGAFYELSTYDKIITSESYYPPLLRFYVDKPKSLLFSDKSINGKEYNLRVYYTPPQIEGASRYITAHYITVHLRNVTEDYYKFKTSMIQHLLNNEEDVLYGMGEPVNIMSNITNGFGIFAGFNNDMVSIHIPEQKINDR